MKSNNRVADINRAKSSIREKLLVPLLITFLVLIVLFITINQLVFKKNFRKLTANTVNKLQKIEDNTAQDINLFASEMDRNFNKLSRQLKEAKTKEINTSLSKSAAVGEIFIERKFRELYDKTRMLTKVDDIKYLIGSEVVKSGNLHKKDEYYEQRFVKARGLTAIYKIVNRIRERAWPSDETTIDLKLFRENGLIVGKSRRYNYNSFSSIYRPEDINLILEGKKEVIKDIVHSPQDGLAMQVYVPIRSVYEVLSGGMIVTLPLNQEFVEQLANYTGNKVAIFDKSGCYASTFEQQFKMKLPQKVWDELQTLGISFAEFKVGGENYKVSYLPIKDQKGSIVGSLGFGTSLATLENSLNQLKHQQESSLNLLSETKLDLLASLKKDSNELVSFLTSTNQRIAQRNFRIMIVLTLVGLALGFLWVLYISDFLLKPLEKLNNAVVDITKGNYNKEVDVKSDDELGNLAQAFNRMTDEIKNNFQKIREQKEQLEDYNKNLEEKVQERTAKIESKNEKLAQKNKKITDSILYAQTIQDSILTEESELQNELDDSFVIWRPKDIVGGDFYWFKRVESGYYLAVVDCTGHGVPGALMTMKTDELLDRIINYKSSSEPAGILKRLNRMLKEALYQDSTDDKINEGLDIGLCYIKSEENSLVYAGAKLDLYYTEQENEIIRVKGDRQSIGYRWSKEDYEYSNYEIELSAGRVFYITSDGYLDQNDEKNNRFRRSRFKTMLAENCSRDLAQQKKNFTAALKEHQGSEEQRDDITLIGFKITGRGD